MHPLGTSCSAPMPTDEIPQRTPTRCKASARSRSCEIPGTVATLHHVTLTLSRHRRIHCSPPTAHTAPTEGIPQRTPIHWRNPTAHTHPLEESHSAHRTHCSSPTAHTRPLELLPTH